MYSSLPPYLPTESKTTDQPLQRLRDERRPPGDPHRPTLLPTLQRRWLLLTSVPSLEPPPSSSRDPAPPPLVSTSLNPRHAQPPPPACVDTPHPPASSLPHCTAHWVAWRSTPVGGGPGSLLSSGAPGSLLRVIPSRLRTVLMGSSRRVPGPRTKGCSSCRVCRMCGGWRGRRCSRPSTCPPSRSSATWGVSVCPGPWSCVWNSVCRP